MRNLERNKQPLSFVNYVDVEKVKDSNGKYTSEEKVIYGRVQKIGANISGAKGSSVVEVFGTDISYDKVVSLTKEDFERSKITENSVFFINVIASFNADGEPLYDYRVKRIAETINQVLIAIEKVN